MSKGWARLTAFTLVLLTLAVSALAAGDAVREELYARKDNERMIDVPGRGEMYYYAQKNPLWSMIHYEYKNSPSYRVFADGGCAPTAGAIAIMAFLDKSELPYLALRTQDRAGFSLCLCSVNAFSCKRHERMPIATPDEFLKFLPLVIGSYASGNNDLNQNWRLAGQGEGGPGGTNADFLLPLCEAYGLECVLTEGRDNREWLDALRNGRAVVCLASSSAQPFSTGNGHYVTAVSIDDEYIYILDPQNKDSYTKAADPKRVLKVVEPGLVRVKLENAGNLGFSKYYAIWREGDAQTQYLVTEE